MQQSISLVTLGVEDYPRAKAFYEAMGWTVTGRRRRRRSSGRTASCSCSGGATSSGADMGVADEGARWSGIALAHNVGSREEVDGVIQLARTNGAEISREPAETFYGGYAGVFRDLDGHAWEVAHNPGFGLDPTAASNCPHEGRPGVGRGPAVPLGLRQVVRRLISRRRCARGTGCSASRSRRRRQSGSADPRSSA